MTFFAHGGTWIKKFVMYVHIIDETLSHKYHPCPISNFEQVNECRISHILCVKQVRFQQDFHSSQNERID